MIAALPEWAAEKLAKPEVKPRERAQEDSDTPERIARLREIVDAWLPAIEGQGSNDATIELVNRGLDLCSHEHVFEAMWELWAPRCTGEWTQEWLREKVYSVQPGQGRDSAIGCEVYPIDFAYTPEPNEHTARKPNHRFNVNQPKELTEMPEPIFWDAKDMIPRDDTNGTTVLIYGQPGSHKTNLTLTIIMDMIERGARVIYAAGEGSLGVGKKRIPAHCAARGIEVGELDALGIVRAVPLLQSGADVAEFIGAINAFKPNVVVIDTLATATAGMDENSSEFSALLTDNGSIGRIKRHFKASVILVAHEGKSAGKGIRGHSGLLGNVDAAIQVTSESPVVRAHVTKMRDGKDGFSLFARVEPVGVPVPVWVTKETAEGLKPKADSTGLRAMWIAALKALGAETGSTRPNGVFMSDILAHMLKADPLLAKSSGALRKRLEPDISDAYKIGFEKTGKTLAALYAISLED